MKTVIVGAGIGGLLTALSLEAAGERDITVYERADEIRGLGVGINLLPHAVRELDELDLLDRISGLSVEPSTLAYYNTFGQLIWSEPRGRGAGYRWPQLSVHRGELQLALRDVVVERLGDVIRLGHQLLGVESGLQHDTARFQNGTEEVEAQADLVVGADGIRSALRTQRYPTEGAPPWSGLTLWRGVAETRQYLDGRTMVMIGDNDQKFVAYPLGRPDPRGRTRINFIAERRGQGTGDGDWNRPVDPTPIIDMFEAWRFDWLDVPELISSSSEILEYPMIDRDPLPRWSYGRSTLLGDAAHAMYPNGSNGASQAVIDARTLTFTLAAAATVEEGLAAYEATRRPAVTGLLEMTRQTGPERVMQLAADRAPTGFDRIDDVFEVGELEDIAASYKLAAGFHPETLNARTSLRAHF